MKKLIMMLLMMGFGFSQGLPQPAIVGEDIDWPTLKISQFVKVDESIGVTDNRVTLGIKQLVEESFQDTRYRLVEDDNADFTANVEVLYIGKPNEAFSIVGLFNRRNQKTYEDKLKFMLKDDIIDKDERAELKILSEKLNLTDKDIGAIEEHIKTKK